MPIRRLALGVCLAVAAAAGSAAPAHARGSYAVMDESRALVAFVASVDRLHDATMRFALACPDGIPYEWTDHMSVTRRPPAASVRNEMYLIRRSSPRSGVLRYRLLARIGGRRSFDTFVGRLLVSSLRGESARVRLRIRSRSTDPDSRCSLNLDHPADHAPGELYAGHTDDDEPVALRRHEGVVEWVSGYGTGCRPRGFMEGIHANALPMTSTSSFGWPGLVEGFSGLGFAQAVQIAGTFDGSRARGTLRIVGSQGRAARRCDTGARRWEAQSG